MGQLSKSTVDIDVLVIRNGFYYKRPPLVTISSYKGNPITDMLELRDICANRLISSFPAANLSPGAKALALSGESLQRKVDLVPCCLEHTQKYEQTWNLAHLGIRLYDVEEKRWVINFPFMHNYLITQKDKRTNGNYSKLVRALKNIKADADDKIKCSSYDIASLVYHIFDSTLLVGEYNNFFFFWMHLLSVSIRS